ncbi:MAG TPA: lanthionine synthetase LanC family protein [Thermoanaerobaculia bacterium]|jgi:lantibiotic modifying enzyme|nr:lanthionine synthetase LanC family protein [Thermoanaerobaculia bacterium]
MSSTTIDLGRGNLFAGLDREPGRWGSPPTAAAGRAWTQAADLITAEVLAKEAMLLGPLHSGAEWRGNLYNGYLGTALFFAVAGRRNPAARDLCGRLLSSFEASPAGVPPSAGAYVGPLSRVLAFDQVAEILGDPELRGRSLDLALREAGPSASHHDVISGNAGSIMVLLGCRAVLPAGDSRRDRLLSVAEACAAEILSHRVRIDGLPATFPPKSGESPRTGFAHGAAGIALALFLVFAENGDPELHRCASSALAFERALFRHEYHAWPSSPDAPTNLPNGWCYGAPGIALARAAILRVLSESGPPPEILSDLQLALEVSWQAPAVPLDHLCCGMFSRVEALRAIAAILGDERPRRAAGTLAIWALRAVKTRLRFSLGGNSPEENLSLLQGLPGVGYSLLRLMDDEDRSPSALLPVHLTHREAC